MKEKLKKAYQMQVDRLLLPRLKVLGWILIFFSFASFAYGIYVHPLPSSDMLETVPEIQTSGLDLTDTMLSKTPSPEEVLNFFSIALVFALIGIFCLNTSKKRLLLFNKRKKTE